MSLFNFCWRGLESLHRYSLDSVHNASRHRDDDAYCRDLREDVSESDGPPKFGLIKRWIRRVISYD